MSAAPQCAGSQRGSHRGPYRGPAWHAVLGNGWNPLLTTRTTLLPPLAIKHNGTYYRFTKDERSSSQTACGFRSNTDERWYMFIDEYGGRGYVPFTTTDLNTRQWSPVAAHTMPGRPRHGTVLPITQAEYDRLLQHWAEPPAARHAERPTRVITRQRLDPRGGAVADPYDGA